MGGGWGAQSGGRPQPPNRPVAPQPQQVNYPTNPTYLPTSYAKSPDPGGKPGWVVGMVVAVLVVLGGVGGWFAWVNLARPAPTEVPQSGSPEPVHTTEPPGPAPAPPVGVKSVPVPDALPQTVGDWTLLRGISTVYANDAGEYVNVEAYEAKPGWEGSFKLGLKDIANLATGFCGGDDLRYHCYMADPKGNSLVIQLSSVDAAPEKVRSLAETVEKG